MFTLTRCKPIIIYCITHAFLGYLPVTMENITPVMHIKYCTMLFFPSRCVPLLVFFLINKANMIWLTKHSVCKIH